MSRIHFPHIPKTAGTNIRQYLYDNFPPEHVLFVYHPETLGFRDGAHQPVCLPPRTVACLSPDAARQFKVIFGHLNIRQFPKDDGARFGTFVRRPVDRIRSWFGHVERSKSVGEALLRDIAGGRDSYDDMIRRHGPIATDNAQVRMLSGTKKPFGQLTEDDFDAARRNIDERFDFVGITERFDESIRVMFKSLALPKAEVPSGLNKGRSRRARTGLDPGAFYVQWDQRLYDYANMKLDRALGAG